MIARIRVRRSGGTHVRPRVWCGPCPIFPSDAITILFTDVEGSTALWQRDRRAMRAAVERCLALLWTAVESHGGEPFKVVGDAIQSAFPTVSGAAAPAEAGRRALMAEDWGGAGSKK